MIGMFNALMWKAVGPLKREDGNLLVVERHRFTGQYRVTISAEVNSDG